MIRVIRGSRPIPTLDAYWATKWACLRKYVSISEQLVNWAKPKAMHTILHANNKLQTELRMAFRNANQRQCEISQWMTHSYDNDWVKSRKLRKCNSKLNSNPSISPWILGAQISGHIKRISETIGPIQSIDITRALTELDSALRKEERRCDLSQWVNHPAKIPIERSQTKIILTHGREGRKEKQTMAYLSARHCNLSLVPVLSTGKLLQSYFNSSYSYQSTFTIS